MTPSERDPLKPSISLLVKLGSVVVLIAGIFARTTNEHRGKLMSKDEREGAEFEKWWEEHKNYGWYSPWPTSHQYIAAQCAWRDACEERKRIPTEDAHHEERKTSGLTVNRALSMTLTHVALSALDEEK